MNDLYNAQESEKNNELAAQMKARKQAAWAIAHIIEARDDRLKHTLTYIHPESTWKIRWDIAVGAVIVYSVLIIPYHLAFDLSDENHQVGFYVN